MSDVRVLVGIEKGAFILDPTASANGGQDDHGWNVD